MNEVHKTENWTQLNWTGTRFRTVDSRLEIQSRVGSNLIGMCLTLLIAVVCGIMSFVILSRIISYIPMNPNSQDNVRSFFITALISIVSGYFFLYNVFAKDIVILTPKAISWSVRLFGRKIGRADEYVQKQARNFSLQPAPLFVNISVAFLPNCGLNYFAGMKTIVFIYEGESEKIFSKKYPNAAKTILTKIVEYRRSNGLPD